MEQKFKRGNKVKVLRGHMIWSNKQGMLDMSPGRVGKEAIIIGSYKDQFGGKGNTGTYTIMFCDTGSEVSWYDNNELEFIEEGGEHLITELLNKKKT